MRRNLFLMAIALFIITGCISPDPSNTVKKFYKALEDGNIDKAVSYFSDEIFAEGGEQKLRLFVV